MAKKSQNLGTAILYLQANSKGFEKSLLRVQKKIETMAKKWARTLNRLGRQFGALGASLVKLGLAAGAAIVPFIKSAVLFDKAMREVNTLLDISEDEFQDLSADVLNLAKALGVDAVVSAEALYTAISAGVPKENVLDFIRVASKVAIAGVTDAETAVSGMTDIIGGYGLAFEEAGRVADIMFQTVKRGKTTFPELSSAIFQVAPIAAKAGVALEEVAAAMATITKTGAPTSVAATQIRSAIQGLIKPNRALLPLIKEWGFESGELMIKQLGLAGALEKVASVASVQTRAGMQKGLGATSALLGSVEALQATLALTGTGAQVFAEDMEAMALSAGAADEAFQKMEAGSARKLEASMARLKVLVTEVGLPLLETLNGILAKLEPVIKSVSEWASKHEKLTTGILLSLAAFAALAIPIGAVFLGISQLFIGAAALVQLFPVLTGVGVKGFLLIGSTIASVLLAFVALAAAGAAFGEMMATGDWSQNFLTRWIDSIKIVGEFIDHIFDKVVGVFNWLTVDVPNAFKSAWSSLFGWLKSAMNIIFLPMSIVIGALNAVIDTINLMDFKIPDWVPGIGGKGFSFDFPMIPMPQFAAGGVMPATGLALVGERGPEIVLMPGGAEVFPSGAAPGVAGAAAGLTINGPLIGQVIVREEMDFREVSIRLVREVKSEMRRQGLVV